MKPGEAFGADYLKSVQPELTNRLTKAMEQDIDKQMARYFELCATARDQQELCANAQSLMNQIKVTLEAAMAAGSAIKGLK